MFKHAICYFRGHLHDSSCNHFFILIDGQMKVMIRKSFNCPRCNKELTTEIEPYMYAPIANGQAIIM